MAEIKVSQLPEATQINDEDLLMIVQGNTNKKITKNNSINVGLATKQDTLVSGTNIKTINSTSLLGSGDISISGTEAKNTYSTSTQDGYSCDYVNKLNTYSTTEQRVGTWIDGKPVYRKVYVGASYVGTSTIDVGLSDISSMIDVKCIALENNATNVWFCNYYDSSNAKLSYYFNASANKIELWTPANKTYKFTFILEYTKTTD